MLVFGQALALCGINDCFGDRVGFDVMPCFHEEVQVGVKDVLAEWRVCKNVVDGLVGKAEPRRTSRIHNGVTKGCVSSRERFGESGQLAIEHVAWTAFCVL